MHSNIYKGFGLFLRIWTILALLLMGACSTNKTATPPSVTGSLASSSTGAPNASDTPSNATPDVNAGNVTITFANLSMNDYTDFKALADEFHRQNPSITVVVIPNDHRAPLNLEDYARQADVVYLDGSNPAMLPGFLSLQPLLDGTLDFKPDDFWPGSLTACENDQGIPYGLPLVVEPLGIFYDPKYFDQAGVAYPQPGWTWEQFEATIDQVSGSTSDGVPVYGLVDGPMNSILGTLINKALVAGNGRLDPQATASSLDWYVQLAKAHKLYPVPVETGSEGATAYKAMGEVVNGISGGKAAMWIDMPQIALGRPQGSRSAYMPFPVDPADDHTTPMSVTCAAISSGTKAPQAAWAWLDFLSRRDLSGMVRPNNPGYLTAYLLPGRQSLTGGSAFWSSLDAVQRNALSYALNHAWYTPAVPWSYYTITANVEQAVDNAVHSGVDLATALQGLVQLPAPSEAGTATPTAGPVVLNTAPVPTPTVASTGLTIHFTAAYFDVNTSFTPYINRKKNLSALAADFKKAHPEITVLFSTDYAYSNDGNDFQALAQSSDCFEFFGPGMIYQSLDESNLLDLAPFLENESGLLNDFYPQFVKPFENEGKLYGLPADVGISYIGYNADLLTQLGIPLPKEGWTVDDLISIANQAANLSATPQVYGYFDSQLYLFHAQNIPYYDASVQPPEATFNRDELAGELARLGQLYQNGAVISIKAFDYTHYSDIAQGRVALWITNGSQNYNVAPGGEVDGKNPIYESDFPFKVGYAPLPLLASGEPSSMFSTVVGYYISSHTTQAKAAACWAWISYLSSRPGIFGGYSPRQSVLPEEGVGQDPAQFTVVQEAIRQYNLEGYQDLYDPILWAYLSEMGGPLLATANGGDVPAALAKAQQESDEYRSCLAREDLSGLNDQQIHKLAQACFAPFMPPTPEPPE